MSTYTFETLNGSQSFVVDRKVPENEAYRDCDKQSYANIMFLQKHAKTIRKKIYNNTFRFVCDNDAMNTAICAYLGQFIQYNYFFVDAIENLVCK